MKKAPKTTKPLRGTPAKVARAVDDLKTKLGKTTDPIERGRLEELIRMASPARDGTDRGEVDADPMNQGENAKRERRPRKF